MNIPHKEIVDMLLVASQAVSDIHFSFALKTCMALLKQVYHIAKYFNTTLNYVCQWKSNIYLTGKVLRACLPAQVVALPEHWVSSSNV